MEVNHVVPQVLLAVSGLLTLVCYVIYKNVNPADGVLRINSGHDENAKNRSSKIFNVNTVKLQHNTSHI